MIYWSRYNCWVVTIQWFNNQHTMKIGKQDFMWCRPRPTSVRLYLLTLILGPNDNQNTNQDKDAESQTFKTNTKTLKNERPKLKSQENHKWGQNTPYDDNGLAKCYGTNSHSQGKSSTYLLSTMQINDWTLPYVWAGDQGCLLFRLQWKHGC